MDKKCPYCGRTLPEEASFCPYCAKNLNQRSEPKTPRHLSSKAIRTAALLLLIAAAAVFFCLQNRPKVYDELGEVNYADQDGSYQFLANASSSRYDIMKEFNLEAGDEERYRFPARLYINHKDSGADAGGIFRQKIQSVQIRVEQPDGSERPVTATEPVTDNSIAPGAAYISFIDFSRNSPEHSQIVWELQMNSGDTLRVRMDLNITPVSTHTFSAETEDLSNAAALQALIDRIAADEAIKPGDTVEILLPAVTYTEPVVLHDRAFNLTGSEENGQRTTFAAGLELRAGGQGSTWINYLTDIDFIGDGTGIGLSAARRAWTTNCRFENWKIAVLAYGSSWVNTRNSVFLNNGIGLRYNSTDGIPADTGFTGNQFTDNGTAVLLENVPTDVLMDFADCVFSGNQTDIDNRCEQPLDISKAVFQ